jgi:hypothetical protein
MTALRTIAKRPTGAEFRWRDPRDHAPIWAQPVSVPFQPLRGRSYDVSRWPR